MDTDNRLSYSIPAAVAATGLSRSTIYAEIAAGRLRSVSVGRRRLLLAEDLRTWLGSHADKANPQSAA